MASRELNVPFPRQRRNGRVSDLENGTHALYVRAIFKVRSHGYQPLSSPVGRLDDLITKNKATLEEEQCDLKAMGLDSGVAGCCLSLSVETGQDSGSCPT